MKKGIIGSICMLFLASCTSHLVQVEIENPAPLPRTEMVEINYSDLANRLQLKGNESVCVTNEAGKEAPYQWIYEGNEQPVKLIFPVLMNGESTAHYEIRPTSQAQKTAHKVYGRLVPERKDDLAWENDRIAFRAYGPALEATGEISNGYDIWVKRTADTIIDKRYRLELQQGISYHSDHGDGLDAYKVGRTLGAGAMAPFVKDTLWLGRNFTKAEVLDNGPLRFVCRLTYAPFEVDGQMVSEVRTVSLDAGSQFNKVIDTYQGLPQGSRVAAGITMHGGNEEYFMDPRRGYVAYLDPMERAEDGETYVAVVFPAAIEKTSIACGHLLSIVPDNVAGNCYYFGAGWNKWGFEDSADWYKHVQQFASLLRFPLKVTIR